MARTPRTALLLIDFMNPLDFAGGRQLAPRAIAAARRTAALKKRLVRNRTPVIYCNDNFGRWDSDFHAVVEHCRELGGAPRGRPLVAGDLQLYGHLPQLAFSSWPPNCLRIADSTLSPKSPRPRE